MTEQKSFGWAQNDGSLLHVEMVQTVYSTVQYSTVQYSTVQYSTVQYSTVQHSAEAVCAVERGFARVRRAGGVRGRAAGRGGAWMEDAAPEDQVTQPSQDTWP